MEDHHWFPQGLESKIQAKCPKLPIHNFLTPLLRCSGPAEDVACDAHGWLHFRRAPKWNDEVQQILDGSQNCCQFLVQMAGAMVEANAEITAKFNPLECQDKRGTVTYPDDIYTRGRGGPEGRWHDTTRLLIEALEECKRDPHRVPYFPLPGGSGLDRTYDEITLILLLSGSLTPGKAVPGAASAAASRTLCEKVSETLPKVIPRVRPNMRPPVRIYPPTPML